MTIKRARTVLGDIESRDLGRVLMHEHLLFDLRAARQVPNTDRERVLADERVRIELLGALRFNPLLIVDNLINLDEDLTCAELMPAMRGGISTFVDPTNITMGRDPAGLQRVAKLTGSNIIMSTGFYLDKTLSPDLFPADVDKIRNKIVREVEVGVGNSGIRAGLIGEVGTSLEISDNEMLSLRGAVKAQAHTGAALMIHLEGWARRGHEVLDIVESEGGDVTRTILCHMNTAAKDVQYQQELLDRGAYLEFDQFGINHVYPPPQGPVPDEVSGAEAIAGLFEKGYNRILISQDVFLKSMLTRYGGHGYAHIVQNLPRVFEAAGIHESQLRVMLEDNPKELLCFAEGE